MARYPDAVDRNSAAYAAQVAAESGISNVTKSASRQVTSRGPIWSLMKTPRYQRRGEIHEKNEWKGSTITGCGTSAHDKAL